MAYAKGKHAFGYCDRTGFRYPLKDLVLEFVDGKPTGFRVGRDVADKDHPQNAIGRVRTDDPQALQNPRPDASRDEGNALWGWGPVWNPAQETFVHVGRVTVVTS